MKITSSLSLVLVCFGLCAKPAAWAQTKPAITPAQEAANAAAYRAAVGNAKTLAKANNPTAAEAVLVALNRAKPNTGAWHQESARRLVQLANDLSRETRQDAATGLVTSALQHLSTAAQSGSDPLAKASALAFAGRIQERYKGDLAAALASYRSAAQLAPKSESIKEAIARLELVDAQNRIKGRSAGR